MIICERCANRCDCEYTPYDVECDTNFKDVRDVYIDKMCHRFGLENEIVIAFCKMCELLPQTKEANALIKAMFDAHMNKQYEDEDE